MTQTACTHCDLLFNKKKLIKKQVATCPRCHEVLYFSDQDYSTSIAILIATLLFYFPAIFLPFLKMGISGQTHEISLWQSIGVIAHGDTIFLAIFVFVLIILNPLFRVIGLLLITIPLQRASPPILNKSTIRFIANISPWNMVEVYLIGVIVTLVKLVSLADVTISQGFIAFCALIILNALISNILSSKRIWRMV